jgi:hypothetical protein
MQLSRRLGPGLVGLWVTFAPAWSESARVPPAIRVRGGLTQITGKGIRVGQTRFRRREPADPFVDVLPGGKVRVYGTGPRGRRDGGHGYLEWNSLEAMIAGADPATGILRLEPKLAGPGAQPWDLYMHRWPEGPEVLYAGVMTPSGRRTVHARWPDDNWTRRVFAFTRARDGRWIMRPQPLFNAVAPDEAPSMVGHAYGHHFKTVRRQTKAGPIEETWLMHEEVAREIETPSGKRLVTELFARKMIDPFTASKARVRLLGVGDPPRLGRRANGDYLLEGPRPFEVSIAGEKLHFITFSSADFANDRYDIHFAWRRGDGIGRYTPITRRAADGSEELLPFAERLKARYGLSWVGRAHVLPRGDGSLIAVFHGVRKAIHPDADYSGAQPTRVHEFHRDLYVAPLKVSLARDGTPRLELVDDPRG